MRDGPEEKHDKTLFGADDLGGCIVDERFSIG
jgi:hypothetical protein